MSPMTPVTVKRRMPRGPCLELQCPLDLAGACNERFGNALDQLRLYLP